MNRIIVFGLFLFVSACSSLSVVDTPSSNQDSRIHFLVLHFTSEHFAESLRLLAEPVGRRVSVHYLVPEPGDETYTRSSLQVHQLVPEARRARHAGTSYWRGWQSLNSSSIGIEIVNRSACINKNPDAELTKPDDQECTFLAFPEEQLEMVVALTQDILARNPDIDPADIIGHADIAPNRRVDPGPLFPWKRLYEGGVGAWYDEETAGRYRRQLEEYPPDILLIQRALRAYGYRVEPTAEHDAQTQFAVRAFQMHFRPTGHSGQMDVESAAILFSLLDKYRGRELRELLAIGTR